MHFNSCITSAVSAVVADDQGNFLSLNLPAADSTAKQDINETKEGKDILNNGQDTRGNSSPVIMGKNSPAASVNTQSSLPKSRLLSPLNKWHLDQKDYQGSVSRFGNVPVK